MCAGASDGTVLSMPFDCSAHPEADSPVAREMQGRLRDDLKNYQDQLNSTKSVMTNQPTATA